MELAGKVFKGSEDIAGLALIVKDLNVNQVSYYSKL